MYLNLFLISSFLWCALYKLSCYHWGGKKKSDLESNKVVLFRTQKGLCILLRMCQKRDFAYRGWHASYTGRQPLPLLLQLYVLYFTIPNIVKLLNWHRSGGNSANIQIPKTSATWLTLETRNLICQQVLYYSEFHNTSWQYRQLIFLSPSFRTKKELLGTEGNLFI